MSIREVTYYEVVCDFEGCGTKTGDMGGDFSAFSDHGWALHDWINGDGYFHDGVTLCAEHAPMDCGECTGASDCTVPVHVHGCYADMGGCDSPEEHDAAEGLGARA